MMKIRNRAAGIGVVLGAALIALTGCAGGGSTTPETEQAQGVVAAAAADAITVADTWVKSAEAGSMTAAFGILENSSDAAVTITSVETTASPMVELHETVDDGSGQMVMREIQGGFVIPAKGQLLLEPGANHIMLMNLPAPVLAGEELSFTVNFSDGSSLEFSAIVKDYAGANEEYAGDMGHGGMSDDHAEDDMSHDHAEHDDH